MSNGLGAKISTILLLFDLVFVSGNLVNSCIVFQQIAKSWEFDFIPNSCVLILILTVSSKLRSFMEIKKYGLTLNQTTP